MDQTVLVGMQTHAGPPDMTPTRVVHPAQGEAETEFSLEDEVLGEHFTRNLQFFGRPGQERIMGAFVIVVGLGVRYLVSPPQNYHLYCNISF